MTVSTAALPTLRKAYARIIRAAKKIGHQLTDEGLLIDWRTKREVEQLRTTIFQHEDGEDQDQKKYLVEVVDLTLALPDLGARTGDWSVVGLINRVVGDAASGQNEVFSKEPEIMARFREARLACEHCGANRYRVRTLVCRKTTGELKQLGMECAVHYVGDAEKEVNELEFQEFVCSLIAAYDDDPTGGAGGGGSHVLWAIDAEDVVAWTLRVQRDAGGFSPSTIKGRYEYDEPVMNMSATWRVVLNRMTEFNRLSELSGDTLVQYEREALQRIPTAEDRAEAQKILSWLAQIEPEAPDEYLTGLKACFAPGWCSNKKLGLACSIERAYSRAMAMAAEKANPPTAPAPEGRVEVEGVILSTKEVETEFGVSHKMLVKLATGAKVYCSIPSGFTGGKGSSIRFKATFTRSPTDQYFSFGKIPKLPKAKAVSDESTFALVEE